MNNTEGEIDRYYKEIDKWVVFNEKTLKNEFLPNTPDGEKKKYYDFWKKWDDNIIIMSKK